MNILILGAGPCGLGAAYYLNKLGHTDSNGRIERYDVLINTSPLDLLVSRCRAIPEQIADAAGDLVHNGGLIDLRARVMTQSAGCISLKAIPLSALAAIQPYRPLHSLLTVWLVLFFTEFLSVVSANFGFMRATLAFLGNYAMKIFPFLK